MNKFLLTNLDCVVSLFLKFFVPPYRCRIVSILYDVSRVLRLVGVVNVASNICFLAYGAFEDLETGRCCQLIIFVVITWFTWQA